MKRENFCHEIKEKSYFQLSYKKQFYMIIENSKIINLKLLRLLKLIVFLYFNEINSQCELYWKYLIRRKKISIKSINNKNRLLFLFVFRGNLNNPPRLFSYWKPAANCIICGNSITQSIIYHQQVTINSLCLFNY